MNTRTLGTKLLSLILCICCLFSMASCGGDAPKGDGASGSDYSEKTADISEIAVPSGADAYKGSNYEAVIRELQNAGFTNIQAEAVEDITSDQIDKDGIVEFISIDGGGFFERKDKFPADASIMIKYHWIPKLAVPISSGDIQSVSASEIGDMFTDAGFEDVSYAEIYDLDPDMIEKAFENEVSVNGKKSFGKNEEIPFDSKIEIVCHYPYEKYTVNIAIDFIPNLFFSKFDVNFLVNGEKQGRLPHLYHHSFIQ